ncbi:MAG: ribonuclease HII [Candidatus Omnitrophica bacterium]|nr:ribonuclease HII [Candidatus Omnitrophota bacterium]MBU2044909.1 ribonuclease HII [Candidatus Omnitrophota bacterium]MBU2251571.1 ribonuclease HII [Candidatus Omnitrophota bacterium]MBU2473869.1 ribonuclease HII [Candidatus Omnitrophota bacterium]
MIVGIDEAGRGPLAGVVVACALSLKREPPFKVKDSKALSALRRQEFFPWLLANSHFSVELASVSEIDKFNILEATFLAFNRAIRALLKKAPSLKQAKFIVDGNIFRTDLALDYQCLKEADKLIEEVSCASVVAKVARDHLMKVLDFLYPKWNFSKHKGYPTKEHFSLIKKYSLSPFHRRSFWPCKDEKLSA